MSTAVHMTQGDNALLLRIAFICGLSKLPALLANTIVAVLRVHCVWLTQGTYSSMAHALYHATEMQLSMCSESFASTTK